MKIIILVAGARAGLEFFQSLLDGHKEVLQLPGTIHFNKSLIKLLSIKSKEKLAKEFIKQYPLFFDSRKSYVERHNMLGNNKSSFFIIDKQKFIKNFINLNRGKKKYKDKLFNNLYLIHKAYNFKTIKYNEKIFIINAHSFEYVKNFNNYFKNLKYEIIHTIRHPYSAITSTIKNWLRYKNGSVLTPNQLYHNLENIFFGISNLQKLKKKIYIIQLENLHVNFNVVMNKFCKMYNLKFSKVLRKSTFHNLKWWGDKISGKNLNGINNKFKASYDLNYFSSKDILYYQKLYKNEFKKYHYKKLSGRILHYCFSPLKCEYMVWKNTITNFRIKHIFSIPIFFLKRIIFFNFILKNNSKLPPSIGLAKNESF